MIQSNLINNILLIGANAIAKMATIIVIFLIPIYLGVDPFNFDQTEITLYIVKIIFLTTFFKVIGGVIGDFVTTSKWSLVGSMASFALAFFCFTTTTEGVIDLGLFFYLLGAGFFDANLNAHLGRLNFEKPIYNERILLITSYVAVLAVALITFYCFQVQKDNPSYIDYSTNSNFNPNGYLSEKPTSEEYLASLQVTFTIFSFLSLLIGIALCFIKNIRFDEKVESIVVPTKSRALTLIGLILVPIGFTLLYSLLSNSGGFKSFGEYVVLQNLSLGDYLLLNQGLLIGLPVIILFLFIKMNTSLKMILSSVFALISLIVFFLLETTGTSSIKYLGYVSFGIAETLFLPTLFATIYRNTRPRYYGSIYGASLFLSSFIAVILFMKIMLSREKALLFIGVALVLTILFFVVSLIIRQDSPKHGILKDTKNLDEF
ncbi:MAG: hypothetical protein ACK46Y_11455 [Fluviicola sp.]